MEKKVYDSGAQSRATHAQYDFNQIYPPRMIDSIPKQGVVIDIGTGVGRDAVAMHSRSNGRLLVIGVDPDTNNYREAKKTYPHKDIVLCHTWDDVAEVKRNRQIAYLVAEAQSLEKPPVSLRADFINCSAVLMFIQPNEQGTFIKHLHDLARPYRNVFLRYRTEQLRDGMSLVDSRTLHNQCLLAGFYIDKMPDFIDPPPSSRGFYWHDYLLTTTHKPE